MKKRLRKKKHVGEFRELGFEVRATLHNEISPEQHEAFVDQWIELVEARGLAFGGGGRAPVFEGFVTRAARGSASEHDRGALSVFLAEHHTVAAHQVGDLVDAWR